MSFLELIVGIWKKRYLQKHERFKGSFIIKKPTPGWANIQNKKGDPEALCTTCRQINSSPYCTYNLREGG